MNCAQPELQFEAPIPEPEIDAERLAELLRTLLERKGWITRRELEALGFQERELRDLSEKDLDGRVFSYPGSPGYKHFDLVTDEEFDRCQALKNQGEKMIAKFVRFHRRWHTRHKPPVEPLS
jgi:hypothetical protein